MKTTLLAVWLALLATLGLVRADTPALTDDEVILRVKLEMLLMQEEINRLDGELDKANAIIQKFKNRSNCA
jgi:hypothetical protein